MSGNPNDLDSLPPIWPSAIFNSSLFQGNTGITKQQADLLYASIYSVRNIGYLNDVVPGTGSASKALILDSSRNISNINNLTATTIDCDNLDINLNDLNLYGTSNSIHFHSTTSSTILMGGSIFNSITMQASAGFILMSGANQYVYLSGSANYIKIDNTSACTSSTTGTIRTSGGIYCGNDSIINANLTMNNITSNLTISGTNSSLNLTGASGILTISNTSQSTSSTSGSIQNAGGIYCGANSRFAGNINLLGSLLITGSIAFQSTSGINMNSNSISNCSTFTLSGIQTSTNTTASTINTNGSLLLAGGIGISNTTDAINSTNGGTFTTAGGMAIAKKLFVGTDLNIGGNLTISGSTVGSVSATITDTGIGTLVNPLTINHLLS